MASTRAYRTWTLLCQNAGFDNKLLIISSNVKLWICSVSLDACLVLSQMVSKVADESAMITLRWQAFKMLRIVVEAVEGSLGKFGNLE